MSQTSRNRRAYCVPSLFSSHILWIRWSTTTNTRVEPKATERKKKSHKSFLQITFHRLTAHAGRLKTPSVCLLFLNSVSPPCGTTNRWIWFQVVKIFKAIKLLHTSWTNWERRVGIAVCPVWGVRLAKGSDATLLGGRSSCCALFLVSKPTPRRPVRNGVVRTGIERWSGVVCVVVRLGLSRSAEGEKKHSRI